MRCYKFKMNKSVMNVRFLTFCELYMSPLIFRLDKFNFNAPGGPEEPINQWVSNVTAGKISRVLKSGSIQGQTSMLILNAAYFKGRVYR